VFSWLRPLVSLALAVRRRAGLHRARRGSVPRSSFGFIINSVMFSYPPSPISLAGDTAALYFEGEPWHSGKVVAL
jgi:hypothetical protein